MSAAIAYWFLSWSLSAAFGLSVGHVPVVMPIVLIFGIPVWLLGIGRGRWPWPVLLVLGLVAVATTYYGFLTALFLIGSETSEAVPASLDGRAIHLYQDRTAPFWSAGYDLHVDLAGGWLRQDLDLPAWVDEHGSGPYDPTTVGVEAGPLPHTFAIVANARAAADSLPVRKRLGVYRVGFGGYIVPVK